jgi:hypothetical protein
LRSIATITPSAKRNPGCVGEVGVVLVIIWSPCSNWNRPVGRFWGDESIPYPDIIVFGPSESIEAPHCPDEEKSGGCAFIDRDGTRHAIAAWSRSMFLCAAQYRSSNRQFVGSGTAISRSTSLRSFRCRQFDHNVISESKELISRQRRAILL